MNDEPISPVPPPSPSSFWAMFFVGLAVLVFSVMMCAGTQSPFPFFVAALGAFISVFFRGYRGIFVGFVGPIGLVALAVIVLCGTGVIPPFRE